MHRAEPLARPRRRRRPSPTKQAGRPGVRVARCSRAWLLPIDGADCDLRSGLSSQFLSEGRCGAFRCRPGIATSLRSGSRSSIAPGQSMSHVCDIDWYELQLYTHARYAAAGTYFRRAPVNSSHSSSSISTNLSLSFPDFTARTMTRRFTIGPITSSIVSLRPSTWTEWPSAVTSNQSLSNGLPAKRL